MKRPILVWLVALCAGALLLAVAVGSRPVPSVLYAVQTGDADKEEEPKEEWPEWTDTKEKIVPIVSVGTPGVRIGAAQVTGPAERVEQVKSVVQLDARFKKTAQVYLYIPSSELAGLNRVQGVAVTALLDYKLMGF
ncbi:MAG: hypothetical protein ACYDCO_07110 [Armatimonadota bacterium]